MGEWEGKRKWGREGRKGKGGEEEEGGRTGCGWVWGRKDGEEDERKGKMGRRMKGRGRTWYGWE